MNLPHIPVKIIPTGSPCPAYRTGDIVQVNESGLYDFVGRRDCQVKITGHRVELEGLENIFLRTNLVSAAAVVKVNPKEAGTGPVLVAYVVPENSLVDGKSIGQAFIELAPHLLAPRVEVLAKLPLGKKGKCDRKRLEQLYVQKMAEVFHQKKTVCRVNSHSVEICLEQLWLEILGYPVDGLNASDDFFHLGGTSLQVAYLINRIHCSLGIELRSTTLYENSTLGHLTRLVKTQGRDSYPRRDGWAEYPGSRLVAWSGSTILFRSGCCLARSCGRPSLLDWSHWIRGRLPSRFTAADAACQASRMSCSCTERVGRGHAHQEDASQV